MSEYYVFDSKRKCFVANTELGVNRMDSGNSGDLRIIRCVNVLRDTPDGLEWVAKCHLRDNGYIVTDAFDD